MRVLIVGAGIGGMTLAALLERQGVTITLIDKAPNFEHAGYMLGLWPLGYRVLHGLSMFERFAAESIEGNNYEVRDNRGAIIKRWSLESVTHRYGPNLSCTRPQLIKLLHEGLEETVVRFDTAVENILLRGNKVDAQFSNGFGGTFDLVVGADGMGSETRRLIFGRQEHFDIGWGGWVWWASTDKVPSETFVEHWGAGRFAGGYPTKDGVGIFAGAPVNGKIECHDPGRNLRIRRHFADMGEMVDSWLDALPNDDAEMYFWRMSDVRSTEWVRGRVVLLGDAAVGFLPTAGIGASMAMESAAVLADELSRTDSRTLELALGLFVKRRRNRVERVQEESRRLARMMFVESPMLAWLRDKLTKLYSVDRLAGSIAKTFEEPI